MFQQDSESFSASCCPTKKAVAIICLAVFLQTKQKLVWHTDPDVSQNLCKARLQKHSFGHLEICQTSTVKLTWKSVQDSDKNKTMYIDAACVTCTTLYCNFFFFFVFIQIKALILTHNSVQEKYSFCIGISDKKIQYIFHFSTQRLGLWFSGKFGNVSYLLPMCFCSEIKTSHVCLHINMVLC